MKTQERIYNRKYKNLALRNIQINHPLFRSFFERIADILLRYNKKKILELGCGQGILAYCLKNKNVDYTGVDISNSGIESIRRLVKNDKFKFLVGDVEKISINDKFDIIFCKDLLHHLRDPLKVLNKFKKNLKEDGLFIAFEANPLNPQFIFLNTLAITREIHYYRTTNSYLKKIFRKSGFEIVDNYRYSIFPYDLIISVKYSPFRYASFLKGKRTIKRITRFDELFSNSPINMLSSYNVVVAKNSNDKKIKH